MWVRIEMAPLDPDPNPYCQYGSGSWTVKMVSEKEKKIISAHPYVEVRCIDGKLVGTVPTVPSNTLAGSIPWVSLARSTLHLFFSPFFPLLSIFLEA